MSQRARGELGTKTALKIRAESVEASSLVENMPRDN
jgi:hypothetical protein